MPTTSSNISPISSTLASTASSQLPRLAELKKSADTSANSPIYTKLYSAKISDISSADLAQIINKEPFSQDFKSWLVRSGQLPVSPNMSSDSIYLKSLSGIPSSNLAELLASFSTSETGKLHQASLTKFSNLLCSKEFAEVKKQLSDRATGASNINVAVEAATFLSSETDPQRALGLLKDPAFIAFQNNLRENYQINPDKNLALVVAKFTNKTDREFLNSENAKTIFAEGNSLLVGRQGDSLAGVFVIFDVVGLPLKEAPTVASDNPTSDKLSSIALSKTASAANRKPLTQASEPHSLFSKLTSSLGNLGKIFSGNRAKPNPVSNLKESPFKEAVELKDKSRSVKAKIEVANQEVATKAASEQFTSLGLDPKKLAQLDKLFPPGSVNQRDNNEILSMAKALLEGWAEQSKGALIGDKRDPDYNPMDREERLKRLTKLSNRIMEFENAFGLPIQGEQDLRSIAKLGDKPFAGFISLRNSEPLNQAQRILGRSIYESSVGDLLNPEKGLLYSALGIKQMAEAGYTDAQVDLLKRFVNAFGVSLADISIDKMPFSFAHLEKLLEDSRFQQLASDKRSEIRAYLEGGRNISLSLLSGMANPVG